MLYRIVREYEDHYVIPECRYRAHVYRHDRPEISVDTFGDTPDAAIARAVRNVDEVCRLTEPELDHLLAGKTPATD